VSLPEDVFEALIGWRAVMPYSALADWVFASPANRGRRPYWPGQLLKTRIKPIAAAAGFGNIGWHTFRHSFSSWGKEALKLEETKELPRHENLSTTSELYGGLSPEAKRRASERLVQYVKQAAPGGIDAAGKVDAGDGDRAMSRLTVPNCPSPHFKVWA
jgi:integrase